MVLNFDRNAGLDQRQHDLGAHILQPVDRRNREVSLFVARAVTQVRHSIPARVPHALLGVDVVVPLVRVLIEPHRVEDEELGFGPPIGGGGDAGGLEVLLGLERDEAGIAGIRLEGQRVVDVAGERERRHREDRIDEGGRHVGQQQHVALVDGLKATDGGPVEAQPFPDHRLIQRGRRDQKCCQVPGRSQNFTSTTWIFFSLISSITCCTSLVVEWMRVSCGSNRRGHGSLGVWGQVLSGS